MDMPYALLFLGNSVLGFGSNASGDVRVIVGTNRCQDLRV